tara:strand:+ start:94 stop:669 length:576 start_codon:yes stop_codon:yes gene_type:complete
MFSFVQILLMILFKFLFSKAFFRQIILSFIILIIVVFVILGWLKSYTDHGLTIRVPDIVGLTINEANTILENKKLVYKVQDSSNYNPKFLSGAVIEQEPKAGSKVKKNRKIYLILNPANYKKTPFPNVVRKTFRQAKLSIEAVGLILGDIKYVDDIGKDEVIELRFKNKKINPGDLIRKKSKIDIVLGNGN